MLLVRYKNGIKEIFIEQKSRHSDLNYKTIEI
jgi:hypothetical protein